MANKKTSEYPYGLLYCPTASEFRIRNAMKMTQSIVDSFGKIIMGKKVVIVIEKKDIEIYQKRFKAATGYQVYFLPYDVDLKMYELSLQNNSKNP